MFMIAEIGMPDNGLVDDDLAVTWILPIGLWLLLRSDVLQRLRAV